MSKTFPVLLAAAIAVGLSLSPARAEAGTIVYSQPATYASAWASEDVTGGATVWRTFDNFALSNDATIGGLTWVGAYVDLSNAIYPPPDSTAFTFRFWADAAGEPAAAPSYEQTVAVADVTRTYVGSGSFGGLKSNVYAFASALPVGLVAMANTQYWLSISSVAAGDAVIFGWVGGSGGNGSTYQLLNGTTEYLRTGDRAFALEAVPEPGALLLLTAGAAATIVRRRTRRQA